VSVVSLEPAVRGSPHVVNIHRPDFMPTATVGPEFDALIRAVLQQFYRLFDDQYDFINLVLALPSFPNNRYHFAVKNDVQGIGVSQFDNTARYGSAGRLQGVNVFPLAAFFDLAESGALHEIGHQWINFLTLPLLATGRPHWPLSSLARGIMGLSIAGSNVGGLFPYDLIPLPDGTYRLQTSQPIGEFTDLDLYLMGLLPADQVGAHVVFRNQNQPICNGCILREPVTVTVPDVIAADGPRLPDAATSPKEFHLATIIVTRERPLNDDEMALLDYFAARGEATEPLPFSSGFVQGTTKPFFLATRGLGSLRTSLSPPQ
jgi:hypothetical protein